MSGADFHVQVVERANTVQAQARDRVRAQRRAGRAPRIEDIVDARGIVIEQREDSIFSEAWTPLAVLFLLIGLLGERSSAFLALGAVLLIIAGVSTWWKNRALDGVSYERHFDRTHLFPGESVTMTMRVTNQKALPLTWLRFVDSIPLAAATHGLYAELIEDNNGRSDLTNTFSVNGREVTERTVTLTFPRRGYQPIGPVRYKSGDIFTLFTIERAYDYRQLLVVYPKVWPLAALGLPAKEPFGEVKVRHSLFTDPVKTRGIRDYQPQDRFRDVHWKATARRGRLQTKVYDPSTGMTVALFLNVATMAKHWMGFDPRLLERAISVTASIASYADGEDWGIGVYANGSVPRSDQSIRVPPGRSPNQLTHVLEALAAVTEFATGSIEKLMQRVSPHLSWSATMVLVTAVVTDEMAIALTRLKEAGRRLVLISLDEAPPPHIYGILTYHIPLTGDTAPDGHRSVTEAALNAIPSPVGTINGRGETS